MKSMPMSEPMVRAILNTTPDIVPAKPLKEGVPCKSVTRRIINPQPSKTITWLGGFWQDGFGRRFKPRYEPGETVYVGEAWALIWEAKCCPWPGLPHRLVDEGCVIYRASSEGVPDRPWKSGRFLRERHARLYLTVMSVRAERLQDIDRDDAIAEGMRPLVADGTAVQCISAGDPVHQFRTLWGELHPKAGTAWLDNPWVWRYELMRVLKVLAHGSS